MDVKNFIEEMETKINNSLQEKIKILNMTQGVSASINDGKINIKFDKEIYETDDITNVLIKGGALITKEGQEKLKKGEKVNLDDFFLINPIGDKL